MSTSKPAAPRISKAASASLALALVSLLLIPLGNVTDALPVVFAMLFSALTAIAVGVFGYRAIQRSHDRLHGLGLAISGITVATMPFLFVGLALPAG